MGPFPHTWSHGDPDFVTGPMANSVQSTWHQYLRRLATYTCLCFGLAGAGYPLENQQFAIEHDWLVVLTILKNISQREGLSHILWKKMFETTNQMTI